VAPKTVKVKRGRRVTVSLKCEAPKGKICSGTFTLKISKRSVKHSFRIKAGKIARIAIKLPKKVRFPRPARTARRGKHGKTRASALHGALVITTKQTGRSPRTRISRGKLTIKS